MDMVSTPPFRSPVEFFGKRHFTWAPKRPIPSPSEKPVKRKRQAARTLDFSGIKVDDEKDLDVSKLNLERLLSQEHITTRLTSLDFERSEGTPSRLPDTSLTSGRNIARRIDFAAATFSPDAENQRSPPSNSSNSSRNSSFIAQIERAAAVSEHRSMASPLVAEKTAEKRRSVEKNSANSAKRARLARLMR